MIVSAFFTFFLLIALPAQAAIKCEIGDPFPYIAPYNMGECPADIQSWMERVNICAHLADELPDRTGDDRAYTETQMNDLRCQNIACDYETLFANHEGDIVYIGILTGYAETVYGENYDLTCSP
jgi:hypothetical protein